MSNSDVLRLEDHRTRRAHRRRLAESLLSVDERRQALVSYLADVADVVSADRVATLWVDEYGPGIPHPHVVVDLLSDRPRRAFQRDALISARDEGVPGVCEYRGGPDGQRGSGWGMVVSLGSDGTRAWFLVADSVTSHASLSSSARDEVMFLAGECSAVVLHQDLDQPRLALRSASDAGERRFPGWHVLRDLEGRDEESEDGRRIALRFVVARLPILLVEDDMTVPEERRWEQAKRAREELTVRGRDGVGGEEARLWERVLGAFESGALDRLGEEVLALALHVEAQGHLHGAGELLTAAYELAAAVGETDTATEAARMAGRTARRRGQWAEAHRWYEAARGVSLAEGRLDRAALVLDGVAATHRERGNLPAARTTLEEALALAEESGDRTARGRVHHGFLGLEQASGHLDRAVGHGWKAVSLYEGDEDRTRGFAGLAGLFEEMGRLDAAEDAWLLVRHLSREDYYTLYALDALSHIAALRGDAAGFARRAAEADALGWESGSRSAKAEILLYRGLSYKALGRQDEARRWLRRALAFAEEAGFSRTLFQAEEALESLGSNEKSDVVPADSTSTPESSGVERDLRAMREELVGAV